MQGLVNPDEIENLYAVGSVTFEPGGKTNWHTHPIGQVLLVTEGKDKDAYLIATAAEGEMKAMEGTITSFRGFLDCLGNVREAGIILGHGVHALGEVKENPCYARGLRSRNEYL